MIDYSTSQVRQALRVTDRKLQWWSQRRYLKPVRTGVYTADQIGVLALALWLMRRWRFIAKRAFRFAQAIHIQWKSTGARYAGLSKLSVFGWHEDNEAIEQATTFTAGLRIVDVPEVIEKAERALLLTTNRRAA